MFDLIIFPALITANMLNDLVNYVHVYVNITSDIFK